MLSENKILGLLYLKLIGIGVLGNYLLLFLCHFHFLTANRTKPIHLIISHLAFSNIVLLLCRGIPNIARVWGVACFMDDLGTRIILYLQAFPRGLSLAITCLLSTFQAIRLTPNSSIWARLKTRATKCIIPCILLAWIFNILVKMVAFVFLPGLKNSTETKDGCNTGYRSLDLYKTNNLMLTIVTFVYDTMLVCLMAYSNGYMIFILYRHKQQIKHIHSNNFTPKTYPETRATKAILLLVGTFIFFNTPSPICIMYMFYFKERSSWLIHGPALLSLCYPTLSPFILINRDTQMLKTCAHSWTEKFLSHQSLMHQLPTKIQRH